MNPRSAILDLKPGGEVVARGFRYRVRGVVGSDRVLCIDPQTREAVTFRVSELEPVPLEESAAPIPDLLEVPEEDWEVAQARFALLQPFLENNWGRMELETYASTAGVSSSSLYRWRKRYQTLGTVAALRPLKPPVRSPRLSADVDAIVRGAIDELYLSKQRLSPTEVAREIARRCKGAGLKAPHPNTVRKRIAQIGGREQASERLGAEAARRFDPIKGSFPGAEWPLSVVQIDHTECDIILVDDHYRRPIGRPWITLAIDVFSRCVAGFYVSFDPPGALSTGLCLAQAILPKDPWLVAKGIEGSWPVCGIPDKVHADNAMEFHGVMLAKACKNYGITLEFRPVARPKYGGHVERLLGTILHKLKTAPGATFSNPQERGRTDSEARAALTLTEFERWLADFIVNDYHRSVHDSLKVPPVKRYEDGILGSEDLEPRGLPRQAGDPLRLRLDFMPYVERSIQPSGIAVDEIHYFSDVLRPWINALDPADPKRKLRVIVRRDPRDLSRVWVWLPGSNSYAEVPYRDIRHPSISIWELREIRKKLLADGRKSVDEQAIFAARDRMREIEKSAKAETAGARRRAQRQRAHLEIARTPVIAPPLPVVATRLSGRDDDEEPDLGWYEVVEELD